MDPLVARAFFLAHRSQFRMVFVFLHLVADDYIQLPSKSF